MQKVFGVTGQFITGPNAGDVILRKGDPGDEAFILVSGEVELVNTNSIDSPKSITLENGCIFGEVREETVPTVILTIKFR